MQEARAKVQAAEAKFAKAENIRNSKEWQAQHRAVTASTSSDAMYVPFPQVGKFPSTGSMGGVTNRRYIAPPLAQRLNPGASPSESLIGELSTSHTSGGKGTFKTLYEANHSVTLLTANVEVVVLSPAHIGYKGPQYEAHLESLSKASESTFNRGEKISVDSIRRRFETPNASFADLMHSIASMAKFRHDVALSCFLASTATVSRVRMETIVSTRYKETDDALGPNGRIEGLRIGMGVFPIASPDMSISDALWAWSGGRLEIIINGLVETIYQAQRLNDAKIARADQKSATRRTASKQSDDEARGASDDERRTVDAVINAQFEHRRNFNIPLEEGEKFDEAYIRTVIDSIRVPAIMTMIDLRAFLIKVDDLFCTTIEKTNDASGKPIRFAQLNANKEMTFPIHPHAHIDRINLNTVETLFKTEAPPSVALAMFVLVGSPNSDKCMEKGGSPLSVLLKQVGAITADYKTKKEAAVVAANKEFQKNHEQERISSAFSGKRKKVDSTAKTANEDIPPQVREAAEKAYDAKTGGISFTVGKGKAPGKNTGTLTVSSRDDYTSIKVNSQTFDRTDKEAIFDNDFRVAIFYKEAFPTFYNRATCKIDGFELGDACLVFVASHKRDALLVPRNLAHDSTLLVTGSGHATFGVVCDPTPLIPGEEVESVHDVLRKHGLLKKLTDEELRERALKEASIRKRMIDLLDVLCDCLKRGEFKDKAQVQKFIQDHNLFCRLPTDWIDPKYKCGSCDKGLDRLDPKLVLVQCSNSDCKKAAEFTWCCGNNGCGEYISIETSTTEDSADTSITGGACCDKDGVCKCAASKAKTSVKRHDWICTHCRDDMRGSGDPLEEQIKNMRNVLFNRLPSPVAAQEEVRAEPAQDSEARNRDNLANLRVGLSGSTQKSVDARNLKRQEHEFKKLADEHFPRMTSGNLDPGICNGATLTVYHETHKLLAPRSNVPTNTNPLDLPATLEPMASMTIMRSNGASTSKVSNTEEVAHNQDDEDNNAAAAKRSDAQNLYLFVVGHCGGGKLSKKNSHYVKIPISASDRLDLLLPILDWLNKGENEAFPNNLNPKLRETLAKTKGEERQRLHSDLLSWELLLRKSHLHQLKVQAQSATGSSSTASTASSSSAPSSSSSSQAKPKGAKVTIKDKQDTAALMQLAIDVSQAIRTRHLTRIDEFASDSNPGGSGDDMMVDELELRALISCQRYVQNILNPERDAEDGTEGEDTAASASDESREDSSSSSSSSSSSFSSSKKRKRDEKKEKNRKAKKAKATSDFEDSGQSATTFCDAVKKNEHSNVLKLVVVALNSRIKKLRVKNLARLKAIHHVTALTIARATGINSCVSNPRVEYQGGWKKMLKRSTTASYMQMMALSRFTNILARKLHRFGSQMITPDEAYTSATCLACRLAKKRSPDRTFKCSCGLHTHRDVTSTGNIAIRSIGLGDIALRGIMVA